MNKIYLAPIQGLTDRIYRTVYPKHFKGITRMFTPFEQADIDKKHRSFPLQRVLPAECEGIPVIPQLISSNPASFNETAEMLFSLDFSEVNLNMGCPSPTVAGKGRGSGMLQSPAYAEGFLAGIKEEYRSRISLKIRTGMRYHDEINEMTAVYNKFSFREIIVHARTMEQKYEGNADLETYLEFSKNSKNQTVFNGDILSKEDYDFAQNAAAGCSVMIGRGILINPFLPEEIITAHEIAAGDKLKRLEAFCMEMMETYSSSLSGDRHFLDKTKEFWSYQSRIFADERKIFKKIKKVTTKANMFHMIDDIFRSQPEFRKYLHGISQNQDPVFP